MKAPEGTRLVAADFNIVSSKDSSWQEILDVREYFMDASGKILRIESTEYDNARTGTNSSVETSRVEVTLEELPGKMREMVLRTLEEKAS